MIKSKEIAFELDVEYFVKRYAITKDDTDEEIFYYIEKYLCGCDDIIYYNFSASEVFDEYIDQIRNVDYKLDVLEIFNDVAENGISYRNKLKWKKAIPIIRKILEENK